jgi:predicted nucleic acid-binding protein
LFVDTWGWLALADARDPAHSKVVQLRRRYAERGVLVTTDYVLDETFTRLFSRCPFREAEKFCTRIFDAQKIGMLILEHITLDRFKAAYRLRLRYGDKPQISFTDLTSFVVMKELGLADVLTADAHFAKVQLGFRTLS